MSSRRRDLADALHLRKPLLHDGRGRVVHLPLLVNIRGQGDNQDGRVGRIDFALGRIGRQVRR